MRVIAAARCDLNIDDRPWADLEGGLGRSGARVRLEQLVHDHRAGLDHRPLLVPVDEFGTAGPAGQAPPGQAGGATPRCAACRPGLTTEEWIGDVHESDATFPAP
jgi:hypothetical protein